jgi:hypothetical protein
MVFSTRLIKIPPTLALVTPAAILNASGSELDQAHGRSEGYFGLYRFNPTPTLDIPSPARYRVSPLWRNIFTGYVPAVKAILV